MLWTARSCESRPVKIYTFRWLGLPPGQHLRCSSIILLVTGIYLLIGVATFAIWRITGNDAWVEGFFQIPGGLLACFLAASQFWFSVQVLRHFDAEEPMHTVWLCIAGSAAFDLAGTICSQVLAAETKLNILTSASWWSHDKAIRLRQYGLLLGGTFRFALLSVALWLALKIYRRNGLLGRMKVMDWVVLAVMGAYVAEEILEIAQASRRRTFPMVEIAGFPVDPLLLLLLLEAVLLYRSAQGMGIGWISRCWTSMAIGVALVCAGVVAMWAARWGYFPWPWNSAIWYIWLPAGAAFALAPVYQLEAILQASGAGERRLT